MSVLDKLIYHWHFPKLNILKTILFNYKVLPLKQAIKLPVYLYGKVDFYFLKGNVEFRNCQLTRGMVTLGKNKEYLGTPKSSLIIMDPNSKLIFNGSCEISSNFLIRIGAKANLNLGKGVFFGSGVKVICINNVKIGKASRIAFESQLIDSDFHYVYNLEKQVVKSRERDIMIGEYNWIGNRTTVSKGTVTQDFTIVAASSMLNKDYTRIEEPYPVLAGLPAKIVSKNVRRIYDLNIEKRLAHFFESGGRELPADWLEEIKLSFSQLD